MITIQKTDHPSFIRNMDTSAILNIDTHGYKKYKDERARIIKLEQLSQSVETLQQDMSDIKTLLQQLVNGRTNG